MTKYSSDKDISKLVRQLIRQNWRYRAGKKHGKLISPFGTFAVVPSSPSDCRAYKNFYQDIQRMNHVAN